jgi:hypothetical protein
VIRRTGLHRHTPLPRTPMPPRTGPLRWHRVRHTATGRSARPTTDWAALRALLWARCEAYCERCGQRLNPIWWDAHHRLLRSQGGPDDIRNLVALHRSCHTGHPESVHNNPTAAETRGLIVRRCNDYTTTPVRLGDGRLVALDAAGGYREVPA